MIKKKSNQTLIGCLCALACESIYGFSYIFTKQATETVSAFALLGWRFLIAFIVMSLCIMFKVVKININIKEKSFKPLLFVGVFSPALYYIGETIGISRTTASESGVFLACIPIASLLASTLILKEKPAKMQLIGISITLVGVLITVFAVGSAASLSVVGYLFLLLAVISYALYSVFVEKASDHSGAEITYAMLLIGAVVFVILSLIEAVMVGNVRELLILPVQNSSFRMAVLYQGIGSSVLAFFLSNAAIAKIGVNRAASFIGASTVVSILAGALFLHENFSALQFAGAAVIIIGVYAANINGKDQA